MKKVKQILIVLIMGIMIIPFTSCEKRNKCEQLKKDVIKYQNLYDDQIIYGLEGNSKYDGVKLELIMHSLNNSKSRKDEFCK